MCTVARPRGEKAASALRARARLQQQVVVHACYGSSSFRLLTAASNVRWPQLTGGSLEAFDVWCRVCAVVRVLCVTR